MSDIDNDSYNTKRAIATFLKIGATKRQVLLPPALPYSQVKRLIEIDPDDDTVVNVDEDCDDDIAEAIVESASNLSFSERIGSAEVEVNMQASLAVLFDRDSQEANQLKGKLWLAVSMQRDPVILGMMTTCFFSRDDALSTSKFTHNYCRENGIPSLSNAMLIDCVVGSPDIRGLGTLMVLSAYMAMQRSRTLNVICSVAVTTGGRALFTDLGFHEHRFREGTQRSFFWARAGDLKARNIKRRLRWDDEVERTCFRRGLTERSADKRYARC